jgi:hypothetical protein
MTTDFESGLRTKMAGIKPTLPPGLAQEVAASHRRHQQSRRRKATHALMAVVPAVALVAGGAVVAAHGTGTASPAATHPAVLTADYVTKKVEATLSSDNYIVETTGNGLVSLHSTGGSITPTLNVLSRGMSVNTWSDPVTGSLQTVIKSAAGTQTTWTTSYEVGKQSNEKSVNVDTATKTAYIFTRILLPGESPMSGYASPSQLKQVLATGQATIANKSVIDGQSVVDLHLRNINDSTLDLWVNARTFRLVKLVEPVQRQAVTTYYHWLPRTKSLVAQINTPQIPAGYRQVGTSK